MTLSALDIALDTLATSDQIDLMCFPGLSAYCGSREDDALDTLALDTLVRWQRVILDHCEAMGDRFANTIGGWVCDSLSLVNPPLPPYLVINERTAAIRRQVEELAKHWYQ
jgi:hypothetical protein